MLIYKALNGLIRTRTIPSHLEVQEGNQTSRLTLNCETDEHLMTLWICKFKLVATGAYCRDVTILITLHFDNPPLHIKCIDCA